MVHYERYSYAQTTSSTFNCSTQHNSPHSLFTENKHCTLSTTTKSRGTYCKVEVQVVWSNVSKCRRDSHHSSHSISPNCLPYDLLLLRFTDIVSHWSKTCFLLKLCRSLFSPFSVDLLIRAITYRDGRFQLADEIVNVNGASLRYQINFNHPCTSARVTSDKTCFTQKIHCRGLTMEEARNLLRSCQGEVSWSSLTKTILSLNMNRPYWVFSLKTTRPRVEALI